MASLHIRIVPKRGEWIIKLNADAYLRPYTYKNAMITATALADAAWQLGHPTSVVLEDRQGEHRTVWDHPAQRNVAYV